MAKLSKDGEVAIRRLVEDLSSGNYGAVEADGRIGRLTLDELRRAVSEYGRTLTPLPGEALELANSYSVEGMEGRTAVDVPLWTVEEGRSDLTLSVTLDEGKDGTTVSIDDLHVL
jgi:hypothetical protein